MKNGDSQRNTNMVILSTINTSVLFRTLAITDKICTKFNKIFINCYPLSCHSLLFINKKTILFAHFTLYFSIDFCFAYGMLHLCHLIKVLLITFCAMLSSTTLNCKKKYLILNTENRVHHPKWMNNLVSNWRGSITDSLTNFQLYDMNIWLEQKLFIYMHVWCQFSWVLNYVYLYY